MAIRFRLPGRINSQVGGLPTTNTGVSDPTKYSRHHICGRKYIQMLFFLCYRARLIRTDGRLRDQLQDLPPETPVSYIHPDVKHFANFDGTQFRQLESAFFWSPWNLFVGPNANYRLFDPSSGVEQNKPLGMPDRRWNVVKRIPQVLEEMGVNLTNLVRHADDAIQTYQVGVRENDQRLLDLFSNIRSDMHGHPRPFRFDAKSWAAVNVDRDSSGILSNLDSVEAIRGLYREALWAGMVEEDMTWDEVADTDGSRFKMVIIKPVYKDYEFQFNRA